MSSLVYAAPTGPPLLSVRILLGVCGLAIILLCLLCVANTLCRRDGKQTPLRMPGKKDSLLGNEVRRLACVCVATTAHRKRV